MDHVTNNLTESQFLMEFASAIVVVIGLMALWREWLLGRAMRRPLRPISLDRYEIIWLTRGRQGAIRAAIRNLIRNGELSPDGTDPSLMRAGIPYSLSHPFESQIYHVVARKGQIGLAQINHNMAKLPVPARLVNERLILSTTSRVMALVPAVFVVPALLFVGGCEAGHLLWSHQPVTPLVLLTVGGSLISTFLCIPNLRTRRGDAMLALLQQSPMPTGWTSRWLSRTTG